MKKGYDYVVYVEIKGEKYYLSEFKDEKRPNGMVAVNHSAVFSTDAKSAIRFDEFHAQWQQAAFEGSKIERANQ